MIAFSHIPRTGGTSLRQFIRDSLPGGSRYAFVDSFAHFAFMTDQDLASLDFLATHCGYGLFCRLPPSVEKVIVLRDPVQRVISLYHDLRCGPQNVSYASAFAHEMTLHEFAASENPAVSVFVENTQTWHLVIDKNASFRRKLAGLSDEAILELAAENLKTFDVIGKTEKLDDMFLRLRQRFGWPEKVMLPRINCGSPAAHDPISADTLSLIRERVALDCKLYEFATTLST